MLTDDRLRELWANGFTITVMAGPFIENFARAVEAEARREALEELIAAGFISNAYVVDAQEHINGKRT